MDWDVTPEYAQLRQQALEVTAEGASLAGDPFGLIMETGYVEGLITMVALSDGSASLYFSGGGGVLGAGVDSELAALARALVLFTRQFRLQFKGAGEHPLPEVGRTQFWLLTEDGVRGAAAWEKDLSGAKLALSPLFHAGHKLMREIVDLDRRASEAQGEEER